MKTINQINFILPVVLLALGSCAKHDQLPIAKPIVFHVILSGANEIPANYSTATGSGTFSYDPLTSVLSGSVVYQGMSSSGAHIHRGVLGEIGQVAFLLGTIPLSSPLLFKSPPLLNSERDDLMTNKYYINLHSEAYPSGEIRGQIVLITSK